MRNATNKQFATHNTQLIIILLAILILAAGCGRNRDDDTGASNTESETVASAEATAQENPAGDPAQGETLYQATCSACHGPDAEGVQGLGKSLHSSESDFVSSRSDQEVVEFIKAGRQPDHPDNDTGVAMPPKGGNPALSDEDLYHIVAWMRTLN